MKGIRRRRRSGDLEGLEHAKVADKRAGEHLERARENGRMAKQLLIRNSLTERFIREIRGNHA